MIAGSPSVFLRPKQGRDDLCDFSNPAAPAAIEVLPKGPYKPIAFSRAPSKKSEGPPIRAPDENAPAIWKSHNSAEITSSPATSRGNLRSLAPSMPPRAQAIHGECLDNRAGLWVDTGKRVGVLLLATYWRDPYKPLPYLFLPPVRGNVFGGDLPYAGSGKNISRLLPFAKFPPTIPEYGGPLRKGLMDSLTNETFKPGGPLRNPSGVVPCQAVVPRSQSQ